MTSLLEAQLKESLKTAICKALGEKFTHLDPMLFQASNPAFGDYQCNLPLNLAKQLQQNPTAIAQTIVECLEVSQFCEPPRIAGSGFINLTLKPSYVAEQLALALADPRLGVPLAEISQRSLVDFSSPNIAKEMHVGHLRSTIIGDCLARILEFRGHDVLRINHVGDWGTQFGMLIAYLEETCPDALTTANALAIEDLVTFYKQAKIRFDEDEIFQTKARKAVVKLQAGDPESRQAWQLLCEQSRQEFQIIYDLLNIRLEERGESFYNPFLSDVITDLDRLGLLVESDGAKCVFLEGFTNQEGNPQPMIVQKFDGGHNYETTDLAAVRYRVEIDRARRILYVVDVGQSNHFEQVFQVARQAGWLPPEVEVIHVSFGLVQGEDGKKLKTRSGDTIKLKDLLKEAISRTRQDLTSRLVQQGKEMTDGEIETLARTIGISAVKYADLSQNRLSNYVFSYDKMLSLQGNTAPYLLYAYVRVRGIDRKSNLERSPVDRNVTLSLNEPTELALGKHLLRFSETIIAVERDLLPNRLCLYLFELSQKFNQFYDNCPILTASIDLKLSRLALCDLTARTLKLGLSLLGINVLERM